MFRLPLIIVLCLVFTLIAGCQQGDGSKEAIVPERQGPAISVEPALIDLGTMEQHETISKVVTISNVGTDSLHISRVKTTCGCTVAKLDVMVLAPGASTPLKIDFNSKRYEGAIEKKITVQSDDPQHANYDVVLNAKIHVPVYVDPPKKTISNQSIKPGEQWTDKVYFTTEDVAELKMRVIEYDADVLEIDIQNGVDGDLQKSVMTVTTMADLIPGDYREFVKVMPNIPGAEFVGISVRARVQGDLRPEKDLVNLGVYAVEEMVSGDVVLAAISKDISFEITGAETTFDGFTTRVENGNEGWKSKVIIEGMPLSLDSKQVQDNRGRIGGDLLIYTDYPKQPMIKVRLMYVVRLQ